METVNIQLPAEVEALAKNVSTEKRSEVQAVLNHVFNGVDKMREQLDSVVVADENDKVNMKLANTIRLGVRQRRLEAEKDFDAKRSEVQQAMLSYKTEDSLWLKAKQTMQILTKEIEENARWKEETAKRIEAEKAALKLQERTLKVHKFDPELQVSDFEYMSDSAFEVFLSGIEKQYNDKIAAEKKAEEDRLAKEKAEAEERERIRKENEALKKKAIEHEKAAKIEAEKRNAEIRKAQEEAKKAQKEFQAKLKAEQEAKEKIEREEKAKRDKLEAELKAKADAEAELLKQAEAEKQAELNKGDSAKVKDLITDLDALKTKYAFKSAKNNKMYSQVGELLDKIINHIS